MNWETKLLEEVVEYFIDYRGKTPNKTTSGIPLVTAKIVKNGALLEPDEFISEEDYPLWMTRGFPEINDVVLTTEAPLGEVALIKDRNVALAQRIITLRGFKDKLDNKFLKYWFQSEYGQYELDSRASGTTVFGIKASVLKKIPVPVPSLPEQQAIASVLSALDDKIDLLQRQNQTLEQMAATLFRQWFIEEAKEEWEEVTIGDLCAIVTKGTTPKSFTTLGVNFIKAESLSGNGAFIKNKFAYISEEVHFNSLKRSVLQKGDLLFSIAGTIGRVAIVTEDILPANTNQALAILRPREINYSNFIYCILKSSLFQGMVDSKVVHAVQPNLSLGEISNSSLRLPKKLVLNQFVDLIEPFFIKIRFNIQQLETLQSLRDTLLPKLISGEVRLKGFETVS